MSNKKQGKIKKKSARTSKKSVEEKREKWRENMRKERARIREDPELYELQKEKERMRWKNRREEKKIKSINDMTEAERCVQRSKWRAAKKRHQVPKRQSNTNGGDTCFSVQRTNFTFESMETQQLGLLMSHSTTWEFSREVCYIINNNYFGYAERESLEKSKQDALVEVPFLKNGSTPSKGRKAKYSLANTCAFDSFFQILIARAAEDEEFRAYV